MSNSEKSKSHLADSIDIRSDQSLIHIGTDLQIFDDLVAYAVQIIKIFPACYEECIA